MTPNRKWYTLAAEQGYASAQARLGALYRDGKGVPQDQVKAYFWLTLASNQRQSEAKAARAALAAKPPPDEVAKAE
jgi:uncharacterized protein